MSLIKQRDTGKPQALDPSFGIRLRKVETLLRRVTHQQVLGGYVGGKDPRIVGVDADPHRSPA